MTNGFGERAQGIGLRLPLFIFSDTLNKNNNLALILVGRISSSSACGAADAAEFGHQYPAYQADIAGETRKALKAFRTDSVYRKRSPIWPMS